MNLHTARKLMLVSLLAAAGACGAQAPEACEAPEAEGHVLGQREELLAQYEQLPQHCLRAMVRACSVAAGSTLLDQGSAAECSISYEALLKRGFQGNFRALMAWWQSGRDDGE